MTTERRRVLVIGGTRFIGAATVRQLVESDCEVVLVHRGETENEALPAVEHIHINRNDLAGHRAVFSEFRPDVVLDMIPLTEKDATILMDTIRGIAQRVVVIGSSDVYRAYGRLIGTEPGIPDPVPLTEESPLREKLFPYRGTIDRLADYDKILVERTALGDPDLPGTVLRLPMVYGPNDKQHRFFGFIKRIDDGRPAILFSEAEAMWRSTYGYVENVAHAIVLAVTDDRAAGRIYNVCDPDAPTQIEWARKVATAAGWTGELTIVPGDLPGAAKDPYDYRQHLAADSTRIRTELGYDELVAREQAIEQTVEWERAHPPDPIDPADFDYNREDRLLSELRTRNK